LRRIFFSFCCGVLIPRMVGTFSLLPQSSIPKTLVPRFSQSSFLFAVAWVSNSPPPIFFRGLPLISLFSTFFAETALLLPSPLVSCSFCPRSEFLFPGKTLRSVAIHGPIPRPTSPFLRDFSNQPLPYHGCQGLHPTRSAQCPPNK